MPYKNKKKQQPGRTRQNYQGGTQQRLLAGEQIAIIRARVTGTGTTTVKANNLAGAFGCVATSATSLRSTTSSVRVLRVKLVVPPPTSGNVNTGRLLWWGGDENETQATLLNSTNNPAKCAIIRSAPPKNSTAAFWNDSTSGIFSIHAPIGSIVEITVMARHTRPGSTGLVPDITIAGLTVGETYYAALSNGLLTIDDGN